MLRYENVSISIFVFIFLLLSLKLSIEKNARLSIQLKKAEPMNKYLLIILLSIVFIGFSNASLYAQESNTTQKTQEDQALESSDEPEAGEDDQEQDVKDKKDKKDKKKKKKSDIPEVRKKPDHLWVSRVYEDKYFLKLMNTRISCHDKLELRPDSTFRLTYQQANATAWCEGRWRQISGDSIVLNCVKNEPKQKQGNLFVETGIRGVEVKGDRVKLPRDITVTPGRKQKFLILKKPK